MVVVRKMLFTSDKWSAQMALKDGLLHEVVPSKALVARA
jgi:enoyl-CoA hydratase/carnithine racemase